MKVEQFFKEWISTRPNLKSEFHDAGIEAMAFADAYHKKQLRISGVVVNEAMEETNTVALEFNKPVISKLSDWEDKSEVELLCDVDKGIKCKDPFPKYRTGVCRNCGGQSN